MILKVGPCFYNLFTKPGSFPSWSKWHSSLELVGILLLSSLKPLTRLSVCPRSAGSQFIAVVVTASYSSHPWQSPELPSSVPAQTFPRKATRSPSEGIHMVHSFWRNIKIILKSELKEIFLKKYIFSEGFPVVNLYLRKVIFTAGR